MAKGSAKLEGGIAPIGGGSGDSGTSGAGTGDAIIGGSGPIDPDSIGSGGTGGGARDAAGVEFDATIHAGLDQRKPDGTWAKRRGRKANGGGNTAPRPKASAANLKNSIDGLSKTLVIVHAGLAGAFSAPELMIDDEESKLLSNAVANVMEQFDLTPDPKTQAIVGLVMASATVYGPRAVMIRARKAQEADAKRTGRASVTTAEGHAVGTTGFSIDGAANGAVPLQ